jgi:hypothetical protein
MSDDDGLKLLGLKLLRQPFPEHHISKLPKGTKAQNQCQANEKINCQICGGRHHPHVRHLDYVGHAALTDRLLDADLMWFWEPLAFDEQGLPRFDKIGGLWIKLTVGGMTRLGYGNAEGKEQMDVGSREKEVIGDALRNAAMRFGAALDLWHKGDLHKADETETETETEPRRPDKESITSEHVDILTALIEETGTDLARFLSAYNARSLPEFPALAFTQAHDLLIKKKAKT